MKEACDMENKRSWLAGGKNINLDDAKQQQHSRDTLINNWQHSAR